MVSDELIKYVRDQITRGQTQESIKASLLTQGWNEIDINQSFLGIQSKRTTNQTTSTIAPSIITALLLFFFYPIGVIIMWIWPKWKVWLKAIITIVPIVIITFIVLLLPYINPIIEQTLAPLSNCVNSCHTDNIQDACIRACQENFLKGK